MRLGLARAAEALLGDEPDRVVGTLNRWNTDAQPLLPWLPGPLLDALAPLGIEVPKSPGGREVSRLLVGLPGDVERLDGAVDDVRDDALATPARRASDDAEEARAEAELLGAVEDAVTVLVVAYRQLSALVADGDRDGAERTADHALDAMRSAATDVDRYAVSLAGARPDRLHPPEPDRPTIDLSKPWTYEPPRRRNDAVVPALAFLAIAVAAALLLIWSVLNGAWP